MPAQVKASLEGAYTALYRANIHPAAPFGDPNLVKVQMGVQVERRIGSAQQSSVIRLLDGPRP